MPFLLQNFFIDSLNYFCKMVSFAHEMLDLREKKSEYTRNEDNSQFYWKWSTDTFFNSMQLLFRLWDDRKICAIWEEFQLK